MAHPLDDVNRTELIEVSRAAGAGSVDRTLQRDELYAVVEGTSPAVDPLSQKRSMMEKHIATNWRRLRTQLPGCNGKCTSFGCPNIIIQRCWLGFRGDML